MLQQSAIVRRLSNRLPSQVFGRYAGFLSRAIAFVVDQLLISLIALAMFIIVRSLLSIGAMNFDSCTTYVEMNSVRDFFHNVCRSVRGATFFASIITGPIYFVVLWTLGGQTVGMAITGVRIVQADGTNLPLTRSLRRLLGYIVCILSLGYGFVRVLWDPRRQGWHDKIANSYAVYSWKHTPVPPMKSPLPPMPVVDDDPA